MPLGHSGYYIPAAWVVWLMFLALILVAALYVQVLHWENRFQANRKDWLLQIRADAKRIKTMRRRLSRVPEIEPLNWFEPFFRGLGSIGFRVLRAVLAAKLGI